MRARQEELECVHSENVKRTVEAKEACDAGVHLLDLLCVDTNKGLDPSVRKILSRLCVRESKTKKQGKVQRALPASQLFTAMPPLESLKIFCHSC